MHRPSPEELDQLKRRASSHPKAAELFHEYLSILQVLERARAENNQPNVDIFEADAKRLRNELEKLI